MAYTPINATTAPGVDLEAYDQEVAKQKKWLANNPGVLDADINKIYAQYEDAIDQTPGGHSWNSAAGGYTQDAGLAQWAQGQGATVTPTRYNGQPGWYQVGGVERTKQEGTAGADEDLMSDADYAIIQQLKAEYAAAQAAGDTAAMEAAHAAAERVRSGYGYTGGSDGSQYLTLGALGISQNGSTGSGYGTPMAGAGASEGTGGIRTPDLISLLEEWKATALEQSGGQIDYAVNQAITDLERALADAQPQFKEQGEAVARDERQALDNSALYAELRGDKGGIGREQYNEIQAAAAQNRLAVQQAQTKLSTDTARQIADLRAQGEFQKADQALEISQQYLSQLMGLEQWAAEFGLSAAQFEASLQQWQAEYDLAMQQFRVDTELSYAQLTGQLSDGTLTLSGKSQLASMGEALLSAGIMPDEDMLAALGLSESQALAYLTAVQSEGAGTGSSGDTGSHGDTGGAYTTEDVLNALFTEAWLSGNPEAHLTNTDAYKAYGLTSKTGLMEQYKNWLNERNAKENNRFVMDVGGLAEMMKDMMEMYRWSPTSLYEAMKQSGYNDAVIDAVFAKLGL